jgi:hypothetical protein
MVEMESLLGKASRLYVNQMSILVFPRPICESKHDYILIENVI